MPVLTKPRVLLGLFFVSLFVAVAVGTYAGLSLAFPAEPISVQVQLCVPEHAIMPEDLDRPDRVVPIPTNCD